MSNQIGLDEAGRGPWAGPLVVAAVKLKPGRVLPDWVCDSKLLSEKRIISAYKEIDPLLDIHLSIITAAEIDDMGLALAVRHGFWLAILDHSTDSTTEVLIDGNIDYLAKTNLNSHAIIDGDATVPIISAASIVAKYKRDQIMKELANCFPEYGLDKSKGYGTRQHRAALLKFGPIEGLHRMSYKPIKEIIRKDSND